MQVVRIHTDDGFHTAILGEPGTKFTSYVAVSFPVRKRRIRNADVTKHTRPLLVAVGKSGQKDYPLKRAANHILRIGRQHGISGGAKELLLAAKA